MKMKIENKCPHCGSNLFRDNFLSENSQPTFSVFCEEYFCPVDKEGIGPTPEEALSNFVTKNILAIKK